MEGQLAPLQPPSAQAFEASELERKSKERDRAKRGRDAKKEAHAAALEEADGLRMDNALLRTQSRKLAAEIEVKDRQIAGRPVPRAPRAPPRGSSA